MRWCVVISDLNTTTQLVLVVLSNSESASWGMFTFISLVQWIKSGAERQVHETQLITVRQHICNNQIKIIGLCGRVQSFEASFQLFKTNQHLNAARGFCMSAQSGRRNTTIILFVELDGSGGCRVFPAHVNQFPITPECCKVQKSKLQQRQTQPFPKCVFS